MLYVVNKEFDIYAGWRVKKMQVSCESAAFAKDAGPKGQFSRNMKPLGFTFLGEPASP